jgi:hypothetical protein
MSVLTHCVCTFDYIYCVKHSFNLPDSPDSETLIGTALFKPYFGEEMAFFESS